MHSWLWRNAAIVLLLSGCSKPLPELTGMDQAAWKNDKHGCQRKRETMIATLAAQKDKLLALSEDEVVMLLGKPDQNELYDRNQKFYYYFFEPSPACGTSTDTTSTAKRVEIRFNAMGLAKEVMIEQ